MLYVEAVTTVLCLGVLALAATQQYFLLSEVAVRILPALCQLTVDPEKSVRDNVFRAIKGYLGKLEKVSEDPTLRESMGKCRRMKCIEWAWDLTSRTECKVMVTSICPINTFAIKHIMGCNFVVCSQSILYGHFLSNTTAIQHCTFHRA